MAGRQVGQRSEQRRRVAQALVIVADDALRAVVVQLIVEESYTVFDVRSLEEARPMLDQMTPSLIVVEPGIHNSPALRDFLDGLASRTSAPATIVLSDRDSAARAASEYSVILLREPFDLDDFVYQIVRTRQGASRPSVRLKVTDEK
jgi:DNA-binding response OmpR family regulator